jgi:serine/threonine-protein kinase
MEPARQRLEGTPYVLDRPLGAGAMGEVWLGEHTSLRRPAVIKLIHPRYAAEAQVVARMRREARIVANLRHDALVTIYDLGETADGRTYIAMEWLEGAVLRELLRARGALPVSEACGLAIQALDGLQAAHSAGVIHRDVKPENLFVTREGKLKVLDFGVAKPMQEGDVTGARTAAGLVLGTPRYMAPEQATGGALSPATDVYALGCVLFELCVGRPVFEGTDARELLLAHMKRPPPSMDARAGRAFEAGLVAIVERSLRKDAAERFASAAEMADALRARVHSWAQASVRAAEDPSLKATVKIDLAAAAARAVPTSHGESLTRSVPAQHLLVGTSTTEHAPMSFPSHAPVAAGAAAAHEATTFGHVRTAQTEVLGTQPGATPDAGALVTYEPISATLVGSGDSALAATAIRATRPRSLALLVVGAAIGAAAAVFAAFVATRDHGRATEVASTHAAEQATSGASAKASGATPAPDVVEAASATTDGRPTPPMNERRPSTTGTVTPASTPTASAIPAPSAIASATAAATASSTTTTTPATAPPTTTTPSPPSHLELARQAMADGDLDLAEREARLAGGGASARLLLGEILERRGKTSLARDLYRKLLESDPDNATAKTRLARLGG